MNKNSALSRLKLPFVAIFTLSLVSFAKAEANEMEEILVTGNPQVLEEFTSMRSGSVIYPEGDIIHARTLADQLTIVPGVSLNGQGGSLQTFAIRGMSRWRIQTRLSGMPLHTERRAGNSASFVDSWLLDSISVTKGPSAVVFGSGAMGGVVSIQPRRFNRPEMRGSYYSEGNVRNLGFGWGGNELSLGLAIEEANKSRDTQSNRLNDGSKRISSTITYEHDLAPDISSTIQLITSIGEDIGKSSSDFPLKRITNYPLESHSLLSWQVQSKKGWILRTSIHDQRLDTRVRTASQQSHNESESLDYYLNGFYHWSGDQYSARLGADYLHRNDINVREQRINLMNSSVSRFSNLSASSKGAGIYADMRWRWNHVQVRTGIRFDHRDQKNQLDDRSAVSEKEMSAFLGTSWFPEDHWELFGQISNGFRYPEVSEMFLTGTTARGHVTGNPGLKNEASSNLELGIRHWGQRVTLQSSLFRVKISNYIERVRLSTDELTFRNIQDGTIEGLEFQMSYLRNQCSFILSGYYLTGRSDTNDRLSDISSPVLQYRLTYHGKKSDWQIIHQYRFRWDKQSNSEIALDPRNGLAFKWTTHYTKKWSFSIWVDNLLNESYRLSADDLSAYASRRGVGISARYTP